MKVFNRVVMTLAALILLAATVAVLIAPVPAVALIRSGLDAFEQAIYQDQFYMIFLAVGVVLAILWVVLFWLEVRRPRRKTVRIKTASDGVAQLGVESVAQSLEYRIDELAGVRKVNTQIRSRGRDVNVVVNLDTSPSVNIPVLTEEIVSMARDIVEGQLGVKIHGRVLVNVKHEPYPRGTMPSTSPFSDEEVAPLGPTSATGSMEPMPAVTPAPPAEPTTMAAHAAAAPAMEDMSEEADLGVLPPLESDAERERKRQEGKPSPF